MDVIEIKPLGHRVEASLLVPGSKSITNRALLLAALADGRSEIEAALISDDTRYLIGALQQLGFGVSLDERTRLIAVKGHGGEIPADAADLFVGGSGTAMRFLAGFLTLGHGRFRLDGNARMRERPIGDLLAALSRLGLDIRSEKNNGCPPVTVNAREPFRGGATSIDAGLSSQFVSALLMPAPIWPYGLDLMIEGITAEPFIAMTLKMMQRAGAQAVMEANRIKIPGGQQYRVGRVSVEADASSASYFAAAAVLLGGVVRLKNLRPDSVQGDIHFLELLEAMGAQVRWQQGGLEVEGSGEFGGLEVDMSPMPDMVATLAILAPFASAPVKIRNVEFIRHHESDRLAALARELTRLGARVSELRDGLVIEPSRLGPAVIETYDDHRIAMSFTILGLRSPGVRILNPGCVSKTYPEFFVDIATLR